MLNYYTPACSGRQYASRLLGVDLHPVCDVQVVDNGMRILSFDSIQLRSRYCEPERAMGKAGNGSIIK